MAVAVLSAVSPSTIRVLAAIAALSAAATAARAEPALFDAEVRMSYGVAAGGGSSRSAVRDSPLVFAVSGSMAIRDQPRVHGYASIIVETLDRSGIGGEGGVMLRPGNLRLRAGAVAIMEPYTLWGAAVGGGYCAPTSGVRVCGDIS